VKYVLEDATALRKKAVADALQKANEMKDNLIASGLSAGRLVGIKYSQRGQTGAIAMWPGSTPGKDVLGKESASSTTPEEVAVRCSLVFTYKIEGPEEK
jgi:uncharacterized protein YggE